MKAKLKGVAALILVMALLLNLPALADALTTGNVNLRSEQGSDCGGARWISSADAGLNESPAYPVGRLKQSITDIIEKYIGKYIGQPGEAGAGANSSGELSSYYRADLIDAAQALGLTNYEQRSDLELNNYYSSGALTIAGNDRVDYLEVLEAGHSVFGAEVGMDVDTASQALEDAGMLKLDSSGDSIIFEHPSDENSLVDVGGVDSCISLEHLDGVVTRISWSSYTG